MPTLKKCLLSVTLLAAFCLDATAQVDPGWKAELGYLDFQYRSLKVDPGPDWKGYYLGKQNGIDLNLAYGVKFRNRVYGGIGIGYLGFEDIHGGDAFAVLDYYILKTKLAPYLHGKAGYSHIWNQYEGGTGTAITEIGAGLNYRVSPKFALSLRTGIALTQQTFFIPVMAGVSF